LFCSCRSSFVCPLITFNGNMNLNLVYPVWWWTVLSTEQIQSYWLQWTCTVTINAICPTCETTLRLFEHFTTPWLWD
jgi:hypothetical protein